MKRLWWIFAMLMAVGSAAQAQPGAYPSKPIKIIVPFTPGSSADTASRYFGQQLADVLGQPFVVENKAGAAGAIAMSAVKSAPADGYTIFLASNSIMSVNPLVVKSLPYEPARHLKPLGGLSRGVNVVVVSVNSRFRTLGDLVAAGKKSGLNGGTYSAGYRLGAEWLASVAGFKFTNVPYKGASQVLSDVIANQLDFAVVSLDGAAPLIKAGQLRAIAISDDKRHAEFPDLSTVQESGYPGFVNYSWDSFYVRSETAPEITSKLANALQQVLGTAATKEFVAKSGRQLMAYGPQEMHDYQVRELERFRAIAEAAGIKPE